MADLRSSLRDALRKVCHNTSLDQLRRKGVRQVNVLGLDRIVSLVEQSVYHSLRNQMVGLDRKEVADATKSEFLRLLQTNQRLTEDRDKLQQVTARAEEEVLHLRRELAEQRSALRRKLEDAARSREEDTQEDDSAITSRVEELCQSVLAGAERVPAVLQEKVLELVLDVVKVERQVAIDAKEQLHSREVDLLRRRIAKVNEALGETERRLSDAVKARSEDSGVASIYRKVQGVNPSDDMFQRKKELVHEIFRANLTLQKRRRS